MLSKSLVQDIYKTKDYIYHICTLTYDIMSAPVKSHYILLSRVEECTAYLPFTAYLSLSFLLSFNACLYMSPTML